MDTCLNINDTTDVENVVLGVMLARPFVIVCVVDNLIATYVKHIAEVTSVFEEEGSQILTGMEMFVIFSNLGEASQNKHIPIYVRC